MPSASIESSTKVKQNLECSLKSQRCMRVSPKASVSTSQQVRHKARKWYALVMYAKWNYSHCAFWLPASGCNGCRKVPKDDWSEMKSQYPSRRTDHSQQRRHEENRSVCELPWKIQQIKSTPSASRVLAGKMSLHRKHLSCSKSNYSVILMRKACRELADLQFVQCIKILAVSFSRFSRNDKVE